MENNQESKVLCLRCGTFMLIRDHDKRSLCAHCGEKTFISARVAHYRLQSLLGVGGMSVVMRARDLILGRRVAIKLLKGSRRDSMELVANFERECSMMARVRHPNVVSLYSAGWEGEQFYIAMELVDGRNLELVIKEIGRIPQYMALSIIQQIVLGLMAAHKAGLLHRDIKPGNVLLLDNGIAKVLDFGLAQQNNEIPVDELIWATPYYVSPETLRQEHEDLRSDIYALGMTLRHMLTAIDVFPSDPQSAAGLLLAKSQLPPLSSDSGYICKDICRIVNKMTQFNSKKRYASYELLALELDASINSINLRRHVKLLRKMRKRKLACIGMLAILFLISMMSIILVNYCSLSSFNQMENAALVMPEEDKHLLAYQQNIAKQNWSLSIDSLIKLSKTSSEPQLGIWASQMAWNICYQTQGSKQELASIRKLMQQHVLTLEAAGKVKLNGLDAETQAHEHWKSLTAQLDFNSRNKISQWVEFSSNLLETQQFSKSHQSDKLKPSLEAMQLLVDTGYLQWGMHDSLYTPWRVQMVALAQSSISDHYDYLQAQGNFVQLEKWAIIMKDSPYAPKNLQKEAIVVQEIAAVGVAYLAALGRRAGNRVKDNQNFNARQAIIRQKFANKDDIVTEYICIELMGRGNYDLARKYFADYNGADTSPFYVMMADWFARLDQVVMN